MSTLGEVAVVPYQASLKNPWDVFVSQSKNATFLFYRDYMDYHADRFQDHSLMFYEKECLAALLPADVQGDTLISHGGLTYGGILSSPKMRTPLMLILFENLQTFLSNRGIKKVVYKAIPHIYHTLPADEDLYALFRCGAALARREVSSTRMRESPIAYSKRRKRGVQKSKKNALGFHPSDDFGSFMRLEKEVLNKRYRVNPVHTENEIRRLARLFPDNIRLFSAVHHQEMVAGIIIYETPRVAHVQYMGSADLGKEFCALDGLIDYLLQEVYPNKPYFDFGISTEQGGHFLNEGLITFKEEFGARAICYDTYEWIIPS